MDRQWLQTQFRLHPDKTKAKLAKALCLDAPAISKILAGTRQIKAHEYIGMRKFFGLPVDGEKSVRSGGTGAYIISPLDQEEQSGGDTISALHDDASPLGDNWVMPASLFISRTKATPEQIRIFAVQESAMVPDFLPGEHILVDISDTKPSPPGVFLISDGLGYIIRQCAYVPHSSPPEITLVVVNKKYGSHTVALDKTKFIGRVIAKLQWF